MSKPSAMVIDASVFLRSVFEDEEGHTQALAVMKDHAFGTLQLVAPTLLPYEVTNGILLALQGNARRADAYHRRQAAVQCGEGETALGSVGRELYDRTCSTTLTAGTRES